MSTKAKTGGRKGAGKGKPNDIMKDAVYGLAVYDKPRTELIGEVGGVYIYGPVTGKGPLPTEHLGNAIEVVNPCVTCGHRWVLLPTAKGRKAVEWQVAAKQCPDCYTPKPKRAPATALNDRTLGFLDAIKRGVPTTPADDESSL